ncbi:hypothetical protein RHOSPDRAFT_33387 [Rhodotorula sp. JG-1b]|nr:hypothetical protein RHOSPDRAFT_33387 [Rhodotorula sp. JG-1b]
MLPTIEDFPDRPDQASHILEQAHGKLARMKEPPTGIDELRYFRRRADEQVDAMQRREVSPEIHLLFHVRAIVRSTRFRGATIGDQATIVLCWAKIECRFGRVENAEAALNWGIAKLSREPKSAGTRRFVETMEMDRLFNRYRLDRLRNIVARVEREAEEERKQAANGGGSSNAATQSSA